MVAKLQVKSRVEFLCLFRGAITMSSPPFEGFARPQSNFYRLPLSWFDTLRTLRARHDRRRIVALVRLTEYIIKWTWGQGNYQGTVRLTLDEIENGRVAGRREGVRVRADRGTGLPRKTLIPTIEDALAYGLLTRVTDDHDRARVRQSYAVRLAAEDTPIPPDRFDGFPAPTSNYFILPNVWTDLTAGVRSDVLILTVEYLFRHCWNWSRQDELHWLTSDEIANGRLHSETTATTPLRYDGGIAYAERKVRDALEQAVANEWVVWRTTPRGGRLRTEFTLRRAGWAPGSWQEPGSLPASPHVEDNSTSAGPKVTPGASSTASAAPAQTTTPGPKVTSRGPNVTASGPKVTPLGPKVTSEGPKVDPEQIYQPIPTIITNPLAPPPQTAESSGVRPVLGGGGTDGYHPVRLLETSQSKRLRRLEYNDLAAGVRVAIDAPAWPDDWPGGAALPVDQVVISEPDFPETAVVVPAAEAARLLWLGLPRTWVCWDPAWLADLPPAAGRNAGTQDETVLPREELVEDILVVMRTNDTRWGHWDLAEALCRCGIAPERVQDLLTTYGRPLVAAWLADLRHDPSVQSVAAVLISNLRKGLTPPSLARRGRAQ